MKKRTTILAIVLLVMGSEIVYYCLTNDLGGFMTDKTIANTSVIQTRNSAIETKETTVQQPNKETNRKIYKTVEQMPEFPEGMQALLHYIRSHLQPPPDSIRNRIQGRVIVRFMVEPDEQLPTPRLLKGFIRFVTGRPFVLSSPCRNGFRVNTMVSPYRSTFTYRSVLRSPIT